MKYMHADSTRVIIDFEWNWMNVQAILKIALDALFYLQQFY